MRASPRCRSRSRWCGDRRGGQAAGAVDLLAAEVGQGTAVLVRTRDDVLVFESGQAYSRESDAGRRVLVPLLRGPRRPARSSHRDSDENGGARSLLGRLDVARDRDVIRGRPSAARRCAADAPLRRQRVEWDGAEAAVFHLAAGDYARTVKSNAVSCGLRVAGGGSALLTGDIECDRESALVIAGAPLKSDVLVVPHDGSRTAPSAAFLDAVHPRMAIFQAGPHRFGHPAPGVIDR